MSPYTRIAALAIAVFSANAQTDPGPRSGAAAAGAALSGLTVKEAKFFDAGKDEFTEIASVSGSIAGTEPGLGPRFNLTSCAGCHAFPAVGGSSPATNPQISLGPSAQVAVLTGLDIIRSNGPVREARFKWVDPLTKAIPDGGVHALFTITGRSDAGGCNIAQPNFKLHQDNQSLVFRIPTPTFGLGLIEGIPDGVILAREAASKPFGVTGHANRNGNDGTVTRFGWKAQNKSLVIFSGEAYNVEQGVTNALFPDERGENGAADPDSCHINATPEDHVHYDQTQPQSVPDNANSFANFMRFLAPPTPGPSFSLTSSGSLLFDSVGCSACHVRSMQTGTNSSAALSNKTVSLYSDLLVHDMGTGLTSLADGISQGNANGSQFRTAPLWGLGQRLFFLHDGRTTDLVQAIKAHGGEATQVISNYNLLTGGQQQDLLNFLRSL